MTERTISRWEIAGIIGGIITPMVIALGTLYLDHQVSTRAADLAQQQDRLARLALVPAFIDALTGPDELKRDIAIRTIDSVLPDESASLLAGVIKADIDPDTTLAAQFALDVAALRPIAAGLYASELQDRQAAFEQLQNSTANDQAVVRSVLDQLKAMPGHLNGTINAWNLLNTMPSEVLSPYGDEIWTLMLRTQGNGPQTAAVAEAVRFKAVGY